MSGVDRNVTSPVSVRPRVSFSEALTVLMQQLPAERVDQDWVARLAVSHGTWPPEFKWLRMGFSRYPHLPEVVIRPVSTQEVATVLAWASAHGVYVIPFGGGSGIVGGSLPPPNSVVLDLKALDRLDVDPGAALADAGAGLSIAELEEALNRIGFTAGHFPQSFFSATVGGMVATNGIGQFSGRYGRMEDIVAGLEVVLADGRVINIRRTPKSSTGPSLNHLFVGSEGTLGVVTRATLRIWPLPSVRRFVSYCFPDTPAGLQALRDMIWRGVSPAVVRLYDEAEAASYYSMLGRDDWRGRRALLIIGSEGEPEMVEAELAVCERVFHAGGGANLGVAPAELWWERRFDTGGMLARNLEAGGVADAIEVGASWSTLEEVWRRMRAAAEPLCTDVHCHFSHIYPEGASIYVIFYARAEDGSDRTAIQLYRTILSRLLTAARAAGGQTSHHHGVGLAKIPWLQQELGAGFTIWQDLKRVLDPASVLNPGVLGLGHRRGDLFSVPPLEEGEGHGEPVPSA